MNGRKPINSLVSLVSLVGPLPKTDTHPAQIIIRIYKCIPSGTKSNLSHHRNNGGHNDHTRPIIKSNSQGIEKNMKNVFLRLSTHHCAVHETRLDSASRINPCGPGCVQPAIRAPATTPSSAKNAWPPLPEVSRRRWLSKLPLNIDTLLRLQWRFDLFLIFLMFLFCFCCCGCCCFCCCCC